jgi:hypothetical protein
MKWLTWQNVGVDRMACAWVIVKLIDPAAEFVFIPEGSSPIPQDLDRQDLAEAAEPFDIPGVRLSHRKGRSSVHTLILEYQLADAALERLARMVDEADEIHEITLEPAAAGLDLICRGIRRSSVDDWVALERGYLIFEALYAEIQHELELSVQPSPQPNPNPQSKGEPQ